MQREIEAEMRKAATELNFEKAAQMRDLLADLKRTTLKTEKFERLPYKLPLAIDPDRDLAELGRLLGLPMPPVRIEGFDISNISGTFAVASMVSFKNGRPDRANYRRFKMKTVVGQDDFACMAETIRRRYTRVLKEAIPASPAPADGSAVASTAEPSTPPTRAETGAEADRPDRGESAALPDLILIDGGKGQLNAACAELAKLRLGHLAVIGLAKEFEEIYRPGEREPLRLDHQTGALKLLQRVRDESHRFANTYNAQLRLKRISESILDEFPGIGTQRKAALLKKFGSVHRLRTATVEQIAEVPGFGGKAAAELKAFLEARTIKP
jgi:excinuclease ABC subunit C